MGIDIFAKWDGMSQAEEDEQHRAVFRADLGRLGYLREAYHGETDINEIGRVLKSYVDFVELCARKEDETGAPCVIIASY